MIDVCVNAVELFSNHYSYSFSLILRKLGTRDLCQYAKKTVEWVFEILMLKLLAIFFKF